MADEGVHLHILGMGTEKGGLVPQSERMPLRQRDGSPVMSPLDEVGLKKLAEAGNGVYQRADYRGDDTEALLDSIGKTSNAEVVANQITRIWNERYFWLVGLAMLAVLPMYRRFPRVFANEETP